VFLEIATIFRKDFFIISKNNFMVVIPEKYNHLKKIYVDTTRIATQLDSPKVYYTIKPEIGYVVCGYCNICFVLKENADIDTERVYFYNERESKKYEQV
tara:strand:+ start:59 stop:355 length:297 start_codon:yes stop_codon:yes gene_type:complete